MSDQKKTDEGLIPRTANEIRERIEEIALRDMHGAERSRLLESLPWSHAQAFLSEGQKDHDQKSWNEQTMVRTTVEVRELIKGYLAFSWLKANTHRALSVRRSIAFFSGCCWLLGDEGEGVLADLEDNDGYGYYGKPQLVRVSELVGFDWRAQDNDQWVDNKGDEPLTAAQVMG